MKYTDWLVAKQLHHAEDLWRGVIFWIYLPVVTAPLLLLEMIVYEVRCAIRLNRPRAQATNHSRKSGRFFRR